MIDALSADSLIPVSGSNFVMTAPGSISGVVVEGDTRRVVWSRNDGAVVDQHPIDGGTLLQVATRGGAGMELVDGLTGRTVENLAMVPGALQALVVAGDGIVVLRPAVLGTGLVAIDFDGTERWSILGSEPVVVGDRIVVRATSTEARSARASSGAGDPTAIGSRPRASPVVRAARTRRRSLDAWAPEHEAVVARRARITRDPRLHGLRSGAVESRSPTTRSSAGGRGTGADRRDRAVAGPVDRSGPALRRSLNACRRSGPGTGRRSGT